MSRQEVHTLTRLKRRSARALAPRRSGRVEASLHPTQFRKPSPQSLEARQHHWAEGVSRVVGLCVGSSSPQPKRLKHLPQNDLQSTLQQFEPVTLGLGS